jgi:multiple sugar transport system substrate-binding protein
VSRLVGRRAVLRGVAGLAGVATLPVMLGSCGVTQAPFTPAPSTPSPAPLPSAAGASPTEAASAVAGTVTIGATAPIGDLIAAFTKESGIRTRVNTLDFHSNGETIDAYLRGAPEDVLMFLTGYLMRDVAAKGLLEPIDDVWASVGPAFRPPLKETSTGDDGHLYAIPYSHGPWAVFYRKSLFVDRGYVIPTTWTEYLSLADRMRRDGIDPLAFGDLEQFPALGLFDILNLRLNGYSFHLDLLGGRQPWTDPRVRDVLDLFRRTLETAQPDPLTRGWGDAVLQFAARHAGMLYFGSFATYQIPGSVIPDVGLFPFPTLGTEFDGEHAVEDPSDAYIVPRNAPSRAADDDATKAFLEFMSTPSAQSEVATIAGGPASLPGIRLAAAKESSLQADAEQVLAAAKHQTQFLDRDTDPRFSGPFGGLLKDFLADPGQPLGPLQDRIQKAWVERA